MANSQIFAVIATRETDSVRREIEKFASDAFYQLTSDTWLVSYEGTTRQLAEHLGIRKGLTGAGLVILVGGYSGRASSDVWEWLKVHRSEDG